MSSDTSIQELYFEAPDISGQNTLTLLQKDDVQTLSKTNSIIEIDINQFKSILKRDVYLNKNTFTQSLNELLINVIDSFLNTFALMKSCEATFFTYLQDTLNPEEIEELGLIVRYIDQKYPQYGEPVISARYDEDFGGFGYFEITLKDCNTEEWRNLSSDLFDKLNLLKGKVVPVCLKALKE